MRKLLYLPVFCMLVSCGQTLFIATTPSDAKITASKDLDPSQDAPAIKLTKENESVVVTASKAGYITTSKTYINNPRVHFEKPEMIILEKDEAYSSSFSTDLANKDIQLKPKNVEDIAWKKISQIATNYFDVIEVLDKNSGYLRTSWESKQFNSATIRTRIIIKSGSIEPLTYKAKIVSEVAQVGTSVKEDELFEEWDRVLKKYEPMIEELQSRL